MCYPVRCQTCGKTDWDGCGKHVEDVMSAVPPSQRCTCPKAKPKPVPMPFGPRASRQR
jgi:hypothetical protein